MIREAISQRILEVSRESQQLSLEIQITQTKLKSVVGALMGIVEKRGVFATKQRFIHVANGVIRFGDDGEVEFGAFSPGDYSRNQSPYAFDAAAECPRRRISCMAFGTASGSLWPQSQALFNHPRCEAKFSSMSTARTGVAFDSG